MTPTTKAKHSEFSQEAAARTMDRLWLTQQSEMDGRTGFEFRVEDIEAVVLEMDAHSPCGVCGQMRCRQRVTDGSCPVW